MGSFAHQIMQLGGNAGARLAVRAAQEQGGLLSGKDPTAFNPSDPIRLWIIQLGECLACIQMFLTIHEVLHNLCRNNHHDNTAPVSFTQKIEATPSHR